MVVVIPIFFPSSLLKNHPSCIVCIHILNVSSKKAQAYYYNCCWLCVYNIAKKSRTIQLKNAIQLSELIEAEQMKTPRTEKTSRGNCITVAKNAKFSMTIFTHWVHKKNGRALLLVVLCYMLPFCVVCLEKKWGLKFTTEPAKKKKKKRLKNSERELWFMYIYTSLEKDFCVLQNYIGQRSGKLYTKLIFYGIFSTAEPLCTCPLILVEPYKSGVSLSSFEGEFLGRCVLWRNFFPKNSR